MQRARLLLLYVASILCVAWGATAHAKPVSAGFRAAILIRALGYERMAAEGQGDFVLAVVGGKDSASAADARMMYDTFQGLSQRLHVATRALRVVFVSHRDIPSTRGELSRLLPHAVYFGVGLEPLAKATVDMLEPRHAVTMCADGAELGEGCVLGVQAVDTGTGSELVVQLSLGRRAGLSFDARLLKLSRVLP